MLADSNLSIKKIPLKVIFQRYLSTLFVILSYLKNRPTTGNRAPSFLFNPFSTIMIAT